MTTPIPPPRPPEPFETWLDFILRDFDEVRGSDCGGNLRVAARAELDALRRERDALKGVLQDVAERYRCEYELSADGHNVETCRDREEAGYTCVPCMVRDVLDPETRERLGGKK